MAAVAIAFIVTFAFALSKPAPGTSPASPQAIAQSAPATPRPPQALSNSKPSPLVSTSGTSDADVICDDASVTDGDTLRCGALRIRLASIDAPEMPGHCRRGRTCVEGDPYASKAAASSNAAKQTRTVTVASWRCARLADAIYPVRKSRAGTRSSATAISPALWVEALILKFRDHQRARLMLLHEPSRLEARHLEQMAIMTAPEAAVGEQHGLFRGKHQIRASGQLPRVKPGAKAPGVQALPEKHFRLRVLAANAGYHPAARGGVDDVR